MGFWCANMLIRHFLIAASFKNRAGFGKHTGSVKASGEDGFVQWFNLQRLTFTSRFSGEAEASSNDLLRNADCCWVACIFIRPQIVQRKARSSDAREKYSIRQPFCIWVCATVHIRWWRGVKQPEDSLRQAVPLAFYLHFPSSGSLLPASLVLCLPFKATSLLSVDGFAQLKKKKQNYWVKGKKRANNSS